MPVLLQIILTNLLVSCDNVGIISLATKGLPERQAERLRRFGILLAPLLAMALVWLTSYLFSVTWLHIRVLGGVLLIYVNYHMLSREERSQRPAAGREGVLMAVLSIVAADLSMSLENSISLLSVVSADGSEPGRREILLIAAGLVICLPVLLWLSGAISRLMERHRIIIYLCAGYLVFMAVKMICEDEAIDLFFRSINFRLATPSAALIGALVVVASMFAGGPWFSQSPRRRRGLIILAFVTAAYALLTLGLTSFLSTGPVIDGLRWNVESFFGFSAYGANAVYTIGTPPHLFPILVLALSGVMYEKAAQRGPCKGYLRTLLEAAACLVVLVVFYTAICTAGLTVTFGFGEFRAVRLVSLLLQIFLLAVYLSIFFLIRCCGKSRVIGTFGCLLFLLVENLALEIFFHIPPLRFFATLTPDFYIHMLARPGANAGWVAHLLLVGGATIAATTCAGSALVKRMRCGRARDAQGVSAVHSRQP